MTFKLILDLAGIPLYGGRVPDTFGHEGQVEVYPFDPEDWPLLDEDFIEPINKLCGTMLDDGDVDYFDAVKCKYLASWLETRIASLKSGRLCNLYMKLLEFSRRAIDLETGVVVEL